MSTVSSPVLERTTGNFVAHPDPTVIPSEGSLGGVVDGNALVSSPPLHTDFGLVPNVTPILRVHVSEDAKSLADRGHGGNLDA